MRLYNRKNTTSSCLIKIDLKKAYDSVEWNFVMEMLHALNFPRKYIGWVITCVQTTRYSITINGGVYGDISGKRGLRQGDPLSPLLFVVCLEYVSSIMRWIADQREFSFIQNASGQNDLQNPRPGVQKICHMQGEHN